MKKIIAMLLALMMVLSLAACGGKNDSSSNRSESTTEQSEVHSNGDSSTKETSFEDLLTSTEWKAILDYSVTYHERTFCFELDGSGSMINDSGKGSDYSWSLSTNVIEVKYESNGSTTYYNFSITSMENTTRLIEEEHNIILVPTSEYQNELEIIKKELINNAREIDWKTAHDLKSTNEAQFAQEYGGEYFKLTAIVNDIGSTYCEISLDGSKVNSTLVYMSNDDLASINKGDTITVIGCVNQYTGNLWDAFLVS